MSQSLKVNALGIGVFAAINAALIATTFVLTKAPIAENIRQQKSDKLFEILGKSATDNNVFAQTITLAGTSFGSKEPIQAHIASYQGILQSLIFPVKTYAGYSGLIELLVGVNADGSISGVRVITHKETPGLGDKLDIKKSPWILSFNGQSKAPNKTWAVKKDGGNFDQFTGATITPRAVVNAVGLVLDYYEEHRSVLLNAVDQQVNNDEN